MISLDHTPTKGTPVKFVNYDTIVEDVVKRYKENPALDAMFKFETTVDLSGYMSKIPSGTTFNGRLHKFLGKELTAVGRLQKWRGESYLTLGKSCKINEVVYYIPVLKERSSYTNNKTN